MGIFNLKQKMYELKIYGDLFVMAMKNDAKLGEESDRCLKTDMKNLTNFDSSTQKSLKFAL